MKRLWCVAIYFCLLQLFPVLALVSPEQADIQEQDWMANILIKGSLSERYSLFCKGSLIDAYWVLSSPACFNDAFGIIDRAVGSDKAEYAVALGNLGGLFRVEERLISTDGNAMLLRLERPADNTPIKVLHYKPAQLKGVQIRIFNNESTASLADSVFNPVGDLPVTCRIGARLFFDDGKMCYVVSKQEYSIFLQMARGRIIDPLAADAPVSPLNSAFIPDTSGDRLYVDFSERNSHPCHEDLGSPIVATLNGELVQVGLVVAAGMATGIPLCNGSFFNNLISLDEQRDFIESSISKGKFAQQCPAKTVLKHEKLSKTQVRFYWDEIYQAEGYRVLFTTALGYEPIQSVDLGNITEVSVNLEPDTTYSLALQAYNSSCTGVMSRPISVVTSI